MKPTAPRGAELFHDLEGHLVQSLRSSRVSDGIMREVLKQVMHKDLAGHVEHPCMVLPIGLNLAGNHAVQCAGNGVAKDGPDQGIRGLPVRCLR